jgi:hypothetical protein
VLQGHSGVVDDRLGTDFREGRPIHKPALFESH